MSRRSRQSLFGWDTEYRDVERRQRYELARRTLRYIEAGVIQLPKRIQAASKCDFRNLISTHVDVVRLAAASAESKQLLSIHTQVEIEKIKQALVHATRSFQQNCISRSSTLSGYKELLHTALNTAESTASCDIIFPNVLTANVSRRLVPLIGQGLEQKLEISRLDGRLKKLNQTFETKCLRKG